MLSSGSSLVQNIPIHYGLSRTSMSSISYSIVEVDELNLLIEN